MTISICPTFYCNNHCNYCYLGKLTQLKLQLDCKLLDKLLASISLKNSIDNIDIFGGDISLLDDEYLLSLNSICKKYTSNINVITNLNRDLSHIFNNISFSLNAERIDYKQTLEKLNIIKHDYSLNIVVLPSIIQLFKSNQYIEYLDNITKKCKSIFFIKYSDSCQATMHYNISECDYEYVIMKACEYFIRSKNLCQCQNILDLMHDYNPLMSSNIFILPNNHYAWIKYDNNREYFLTSRDLLDYYRECLNEYNIYVQRCSCCKFFKKCYAEHLNFNKQCSGHKDLKNWFNENCISKINKLMQFML